MNSFCQNCGNEIPAGNSFCPNCGTSVNPSQQANYQNVNNGNPYNQNGGGYSNPNNGGYNNQNNGGYGNPNPYNGNPYNNNPYGGNPYGGNPYGRPMIQERNIALCIILSIITCGIYGLIWFITMTNESNEVSGDNSTSGGLAFLYTILTCGIYTFYWNYKMGKKLYEAGQRYNKSISDNSVLYLVLSFFGLGIVSYCLIQSDLNKFANN